MFCSTPTEKQHGPISPRADPAQYAHWRGDDKHRQRSQQHRGWMNADGGVFQPELEDRKVQALQPSARMSAAADKPKPGVLASQLAQGAGLAQLLMLTFRALIHASLRKPQRPDLHSQGHLRKSAMPVRGDPVASCGANMRGICRYIA